MPRQSEIPLLTAFGELQSMKGAAMGTEAVTVQTLPRVSRICFRFLLPLATALFVGFLAFMTYKELVSELQVSIADYAASLDSRGQTVRQYRLKAKYKTIRTSLRCRYTNDLAYQKIARFLMRGIDCDQRPEPL